MPKNHDVKKGDLVRLHIEKLSFGEGDGIAKLDKLVVFVPLTTPGDVIDAKITFKKKSFARAQIINVVEQGPARRQPPCSVFGSCGGCQWQHVDYPTQLKIKSQLLKEALDRAGVKYQKILPIISSPTEFHYRNRIQVHFKNGEFGFRARKSHELVTTNSCKIAEVELIEKAEEISKEAKGRCEIYRSIEGSVIFRNAGECVENSFFSQVNTGMNQILQSLVSKEVPRQSRYVWDLYGGSGNFSLTLAGHLPNAEFTCVDANSQNIVNGAKLAREMGVTQVSFISQMTNEFLKTRPPGEVCIVDPPRAGLDGETIQLISESSVSKLIYISCDPMTLIRDLREFQDRNWMIRDVQPLDMFPQTFHLETMVTLKPACDTQHIILKRNVKVLTNLFL